MTAFKHRDRWIGKREREGRTRNETGWDEPIHLNKRENQKQRKEKQQLTFSGRGVFSMVFASLINRTIPIDGETVSACIIPQCRDLP